MIAAVPLAPSLVAVIVVAPGATPVTRPFPFTVATALLPLDQLIVRPGSGFPFASSGVPVSCRVWPAATVADAGLTTTDATAGWAHVTTTSPVSLFCPGWLVAATRKEPPS